MFDDYVASNEDLDTIAEGINYVWKPELNYIFKEKSRIENTAVISYDSSNIYLFGYKKDIEKIPHQIKIPEKELRGWNTGIYFEELNSYLPRIIVESSRNALPRISGPLLKPMLETQKNRKRNPNAYTTKESYLATIVHEFGHVYYNSFGRWYFSNLENNLMYMNLALALFENRKRISDLKIQLPTDYSVSEIFAFCTDYSASSLFWTKHKKDIDKMQAADIKNAIKKEREIDLNEEDSYLSDNKMGHHLRAAVLGRILIDKYPKEWPNKLLELNTL